LYLDLRANELQFGNYCHKLVGFGRGDDIDPFPVWLPTYHNIGNTTLIMVINHSLYLCYKVQR